MTLKMYEIIDFPSFFEKVRNQKLSFKTSYRLTILAGEIEKHINFYQENFRNLLNAYGKKDENGNIIPTADGQGIMLIEETIPEFNTKYNELRTLDVELPDVSFGVDEFGDTELTPMEVYMIKPFIKD
jgi:hypothetical protein